MMGQLEASYSVVHKGWRLFQVQALRPHPPETQMCREGWEGPGIGTFNKWPWVTLMLLKAAVSETSR